MAKAQKQEEQKTEETTAVAQTTQGGELQAMPDNWGNEAPISNQERLTPKLHLMQGQSTLVAEDKAKMGDIVDLVAGTVVGSPKEPVEFIPIKKLPSTWVIYDRVWDDKGGSERVFKEIVLVDKSNADWDWTVRADQKDENSRVIRENDYSINFLVLLAKDPAFPYALSFKRTSVKAGKKLVHHFDRARADKVPPAKFVLKLTSVKHEKDKKPYYAFDVLSDRRPSTAEELNAAWNWFQATKDIDVKVDNSDLHESSEPIEVDSEVKDTSQY